MKNVLAPVSNLSELIACIMTVAMMVHIVTNVSLRVTVNGYVPATIETVSYYYMIAAVFLGIFVATYHEAHIRVDVFYNLFRKSVRHVIDVFASIVLFVYLALFAYGLLLRALRSTAHGEFVETIFFDLPVWPTRWLALAGMGLAFMAAGYIAIRTVRRPSSSGPGER